jgi:adenylate cyclase
MPDLIAQGRRPQDRWRRTLPDVGVSAVLGRTSQPWAVSWDERISRQHASMVWNGERLEVNRLPEARNAIFYQGRQCDQFYCSVGDYFVIGQTTFTLLDQQLSFTHVEHPAIAEQTFSAHMLRQNKFKDADRRIETLSKLPELIASATTDQELCGRIVNLLLEGVPQANFVAILKLKATGDSEVVQKQNLTKADQEITSTDKTITRVQFTSPTEIDVPTALEVLHWDCRAMSGHVFSPSVGLVRTAAQSTESVLHIWNRSVADNANFTQSENVDWAFCTPVVSEACPGWVIYVAGDFPSTTVFGFLQPGADALQDDLKFTELTATTLAALRQVRILQRRQDSLRNFFAPVVMDALAGRDPEKVLQPRETDVSVLFCDLRGFSKQSEEAGNKLLELLHRVSGALGVMTHHILARGGVVGDFHGDAAMGFWGWPIADERTIEQTCLTALEIIREFERASAEASHPLANFRAGLGIASGPAVAGSIGTADQVKVTVFGPVVNLASRLESMTKQLQASVLIDETTAMWIRENRERTSLRVRRIARVLPYGMKTPLTVSELLPPEGPDCVLSDAHLKYYEQALDHFIAGEWNDAFRLLHLVPAEDQVKDFLTFIIAQNRRVAPANWNGIIELPNK